MKKVLSVLLALTLCFVCGVSAFAAVSPSPDKYYTIDAEAAVIGAGAVVAAPTVGKAGQIVVLTATASEGYVFDHWELDGMFEIVEGTIYDPEIKVEIVPDANNKTHGDLEDRADITADAHFKPLDEEATTGEQETAKPDVSPDSPQTGVMDTQAIMVIALAVIGLMTVAVVYKKRTEKAK